MRPAFSPMRDRAAAARSLAGVNICCVKSWECLGALLEHATDDLGELVLAVRLGDVAVGAERESPADVRELRLYREQHDRQHGEFRPRAQPGEDVEAVAVG